MRGTELTEKQLKAAEQFILGARAKDNTQTPESDQIVSQRWADLVRIVAWYGAIRASSMLLGGTVEEPGETFKTAAEQARQAEAVLEERTRDAHNLKSPVHVICNQNLTEALAAAIEQTQTIERMDAELKRVYELVTHWSGEARRLEAELAERTRERDEARAERNAAQKAIERLTKEPSFHFSDEQILASLDVAKITRQNIRARLSLMTTGEKYSIYRAAHLLATRTQEAQKQTQAQTEIAAI